MACDGSEQKSFFRVLMRCEYAREVFLMFMAVDHHQKWVFGLFCSSNSLTKQREIKRKPNTREREREKEEQVMISLDISLKMVFCCFASSKSSGSQSFCWFCTLSTTSMRRKAQYGRTTHSLEGFYVSSDKLQHSLR